MIPSGSDMIVVEVGQQGQGRRGGLWGGIVAGTGTWIWTWTSRLLLHGVEKQMQSRAHLHLFLVHQPLSLPTLNLHSSFVARVRYGRAGSGPRRAEKCVCSSATVQWPQCSGERMLLSCGNRRWRGARFASSSGLLWLRWRARVAASTTPITCHYVFRLAWCCPDASRRRRRRGPSRKTNARRESRVARLFLAPRHWRGV
ncbi:hypothetical protein BC567DRAFT_233996 [Phyllosticta citribraziliensis]